MNALLGADALRRIAEEALRHSTAEQTEVVVDNSQLALTRFAANAIHQNVVERNTTVTVRAVFGKRIGSASSNRVDAEGLRRVVEDAVAIARLSQEDPDFVSLPTPAGQAPHATVGNGTIRSDPERRATVAGTVCALAHAAGLEASGSISATVNELAVANSLGIFNYTPMTAGQVVALVHGNGGSGYAAENDLEVEAIDAEALARRAVRKAQANRDPVTIEPGSYTVVLEPDAVADLMNFLAMLGFGARSVREGTSFISGKLGEQVLGSNITIRDDGLDPTGLPRPIDTEGVPRRPLQLIQAGVPRDVAYDSYYANRDRTQSTGHALRGHWTTDPLPINLFLSPGDASLEQLIAAVDRGILVTRFHYTRPVHPLHVIVTGMTRDGTFLIEHGEIGRPVKNLRFTQSYVEALRQVEALGKDTRLVGEWLVSRVPALRISGFKFTGITD